MVFADGKSENLAAKLDYIMKNVQRLKYIGKNGRKVYESVFKKNIFVKNMLGLVNKLIK